MSKIFPATYSKPPKIQIFATIPCWIWAFVLLPMFMPFLGLGLWEQWEISVWLEIGYHIANGLLALLLIHNYLKDEWFMVSVDIRYYLKHVALTVGLIAGAEYVLLKTLSFLRVDIISVAECLPVVEMFVSHTPLFTVDLEPIFGTISLSLFAPISICGFFYCFGFAPVCYKKPWLAYLCIAGITLIPTVINILWRGEALFYLGAYLVQLPIHLLACWSYQKTDNVWTPLISLVVTNLLTSLLLPILLLR